jgi:hypothetical protein
VHERIFKKHWAGSHSLLSIKKGLDLLHAEEEKNNRETW